MNKSLFLKPLILASIISMIAALFLFPDSSYTLYVEKVGSNIIDVTSYLGYGFLFSVFFVSGPVFLFAVFSYLFLVIIGRDLYRWSPNESIHHVLRKILKLRNSFHLIGLLLITLCYAIFIRHLSDAESIVLIRKILLYVFFTVEALYCLFTFNCAGQALKLAKNDLPMNRSFRINTTKDQCWIYSKNDKTTFRTVLGSDENFNWEFKSSYATKE